MADDLSIEEQIIARRKEIIRKGAAADAGYSVPSREGMTERERLNEAVRNSGRAIDPTTHAIRETFEENPEAYREARGARGAREVREAAGDSAPEEMPEYVKDEMGNTTVTSTRPRTAFGRERSVAPNSATIMDPMGKTDGTFTDIPAATRKMALDIADDLAGKEGIDTRDMEAMEEVYERAIKIADKELGTAQLKDRNALTAVTDPAVQREQAADSTQGGAASWAFDLTFGRNLFTNFLSEAMFGKDMNDLVDDEVTAWRNRVGDAMGVDWSDEESVRVKAPWMLLSRQKTYTGEVDARKEWLFSSILDAAPSTVIMPWALGNLSGEKPMVMGGDEHLKYIQQQGGDVVDWYGMAKTTLNNWGVPEGLQPHLAASMVALPVIFEPDFIGVATAGTAKAARLAKGLGAMDNSVGKAVRKYVGASAVASSLATELRSAGKFAEAADNLEDAEESTKAMKEAASKLRGMSLGGGSGENAVKLLLAHVATEIPRTVYDRGLALVESIQKATERATKAGIESTKAERKWAEAGNAGQAKDAELAIKQSEAKAAANLWAELEADIAEFRTLYEAIYKGADKKKEAAVKALLRQTDPAKIKKALEADPSLIPALMLEGANMGLEVGSGTTKVVAQAALQTASKGGKAKGAVSQADLAAAKHEYEEATAALKVEEAHAAKSKAAPKAAPAGDTAPDKLAARNEFHEAQLAKAEGRAARTAKTLEKMNKSGTPVQKARAEKAHKKAAEALEMEQAAYKRPTGDKPTPKAEAAAPPEFDNLKAAQERFAKAKANLAGVTGKAGKSIEALAAKGAGLKARGSALPKKGGEAKVSAQREALRASTAKKSDKALKRVHKQNRMLEEGQKGMGLARTLSIAIKKLADELDEGAMALWKQPKAMAKNPSISNFLRTTRKEAQAKGYLDMDPEAYLAHLKAVVGEQSNQAVLDAVLDVSPEMRKATTEGKLTPDEFNKAFNDEKDMYTAMSSGGSLEGNRLGNIIATVGGQQLDNPFTALARKGLTVAKERFMAPLAEVGTEASIQAFAEAQVRTISYLQSRGVIASMGIGSAASKAQKLILRRGYERFHNMEHEIQYMAKGAKTPEEAVENIRKYLTSTASVDIKSHMTAGNVGDMSIEQRAEQMLRIYLASDDEVALADPAVQAILTAWMAKGSASEGLASKALGELRKWAADPQSGSLLLWLETELPDLTKGSDWLGRLDKQDSFYFTSRGLAALANTHTAVMDWSKHSRVEDAEGVMAAINFMQKTDAHKAGIFTKGNLDEAQKIMREYGAAMASSAHWKVESGKGPLAVLKIAGDLQAVQQNFVTLALDEGANVVIPANYLQALGAIPRKLAKKMQETSGKTSSGVLEGFLTAWRHSIIMGWGIPRIAHFSVTAVGDWSQMATSVGIIKATQLSLQNLPTLIPKVGVPFHDALLRNSADNPLLRVFGEALPDVYHILKASDKDLVANFDGIFTGREMMRHALEDGVYDSMHALDKQLLVEALVKDGVRVVGKSSMWDNIRKNMKSGGPLVEDAAELLQTSQLRQRLALYTYLRKEMPRDEAAEMLREALYDWSISMPDWQRSSALGLAAFFNYTKNMFKQLGSFFAEDLTGAEGLLQVVKGTTKMGRAMDIIRVQDMLGQVGTWQDPDTPVGRVGRYNNELGKMAPWYETMRGVLFSRQLTPEEQHYELQHGGRLRNWATIMQPATTTMDQVGKMMWASTTVAYAYAMAVDALGVEDNRDVASFEDVVSRSIDALAETFVPVARDVAQAALTSTAISAGGVSLEVQGKFGESRPHPGLVKAIKAIEGTPLEAWIGEVHDGPLLKRKEDQTVEWASTGAAQVARVVAAIPQFMSLLRAADHGFSAAQQESFLEGLRVGFAKELGIMPERLHDPAGSWDKGVKARGMEKSKRVTEMETQGAVIRRMPDTYKE